MVENRSVQPSRNCRIPLSGHNLREGNERQAKYFSRKVSKYEAKECRRNVAGRERDVTLTDFLPSSFE